MPKPPKAKGTRGDDILFGGDAKDNINGGKGNDFIDGGDGKNHLKGGKGDDTLLSGDGKDHLDGGKGNDVLDGGGGDDRLSGGDGDDSVDGGAGNDRLRGQDGLDTLNGGAGNDLIDGGDDNDQLDGGTGDDTLFGGNGSDTILGGEGNDRLFGEDSHAWRDSIGFSHHHNRGNDHGHRGRGHEAITYDDYLDGGDGQDLVAGGLGNDTVIGGAGDDTVFAGVGDDQAIYTAAANIGASDEYRGGDGVDTLVLQLNRAEWFSPAVQQDVADFLVFLADHTDPVTGQADEAEFQFTAFDLRAREFETLRIFVGDLELDPTDEAVIAHADAMTVNEDDLVADFTDGTTGLTASVLDNDEVPDLAYSLRLVSGVGPDHGTLVFAEGTPGDPDGAFSFDPLHDFDYLAAGESTTVSFVYEVTDADRDTHQATVTLTVTGTNDIPVIGIATLNGAVAEVIDFQPGEDTDLHSADGSFAFTDLDRTDVHLVSVTALAAGYRGTMTAVVADDTTGDGVGQIDWHYEASDTELDNLGQNEVILQTYTVDIDDENGGHANRQVTISLTGANDQPVAEVDVAEVAGGGTVLVDVLANDTDVDNDDVLTLVSVGDSRLGTASVVNGQLQYVAGAASGVDYISYTITDRFGGTTTGTAIVLVAGDGLAPTLGSAAAETITTGGANDLIIGGKGADIINAGGGNDFVVWSFGDGDDTIDGGDGFDEVSIVLSDADNSPITVGTDAYGNVIITGVGYSLTLNGVEELTFSGGPTGANITLGDLSNSDIAQNTVQFFGDNGSGTGANNWNDYFNGAASNRTNELYGMRGNDTLISGSGNDLLMGGEGTDSLNAGAGNDTLDGGLGGDFMAGGLGNDQYVVQDSLDLVVEYGGGGVDTVTVSHLSAYSLSIEVENLILSNPVDVSLRTLQGLGNALANVITGNAANNYLSGAAGADYITGGEGGDNIDGGSDNDTLLGDAGQDTLYGGSGTDSLLGGSGNDNLDGGGYASGADVLVGGSGDDRYMVHVGGEVISEGFNQGYDSVRSNAHSYAISANIEVLSLGDYQGVTYGYGNDSDNTLFGNSIGNHLEGNGGDDTLYGYGGSDSLYGGDGRDYLSGGVGDDTLDGGIGIDTLDGGTGNDTYYVNHFYDRVTELNGDGVDQIISTTGYNLREDFHLYGYVENLILVGVDRIYGNGNSLNNLLSSNNNSHELNGEAGEDTIYGWGGADTLRGGDGNDTIYGGSENDHLFGDFGNDYLNGDSGADTINGGVGNDYLYGGDGLDSLNGDSGNDTLDGGSQFDADILIGGEGDDVYQINSGNEVVTETAHPNSGYDTVLSNAHAYTLAANVEALVLGDHAGVTFGYGNAGAQTITGNSIGNSLEGRGGNDALNGLGGDDFIWANGTGSSTLSGGEGNDTLNGSWGGGTDYMYGGNGNDTFYAGGWDPDDPYNNFFGSAPWTDVMTGDGGSDRFYVTASATTLGGSPASRVIITDFTHGDDHLLSSFGFFDGFTFGGRVTSPGWGAIDDYANGIVDNLFNIGSDVYFTINGSNIQVVLQGAGYVTWDDFIL